MTKTVPVFRGFKEMMNPNSDSWWSTDLADAISHATKDNEGDGWVAKAELTLLPDAQGKYLIGEQGRVLEVIGGPENIARVFDTTNYYAWGMKPSSEHHQDGDWYYTSPSYGRENIKIINIMSAYDAQTYLDLANM